MQLFIIPTDTCFWIATPINDIEWYQKIYEIKNRDFSKPLAILIDSFECLEKNTYLNEKQIEFLKKYDKAFTVLCETKSDIIDPKILNKNQYKKVAFRLAHNFMHHKLIRLNWPLFLTSANRAWESELFWSHDVREIFKSEIKKYNIKVLAHPSFCIKSRQKSSDIIEFIWESLEINYIRKN